MDLSAPSAARTQAPRWPALAMAAVVLTAVGLLVAQRVDDGQVRLVAAIVGYALGALAATALASVYRAGANTARLSTEFRPIPWLDRMVTALLFLGVVVGLAQAFFIATEMAK